MMPRIAFVMLPPCPSRECGDYPDRHVGRAAVGRRTAQFQEQIAHYAAVASVRGGTNPARTRPWVCLRTLSPISREIATR